MKNPIYFQEVEDLRDQLYPLKSQLASYQDLPPVRYLVITEALKF